MCGRFAIIDINAIFSRYRAIITEDARKAITPRYNIAPSQFVPIIHQNKEQEVLIEMMKWGLVPFWAKDPKIGNKMINARAETIAEKPSFKHLLKSKRCLVPCSGFYEWKKVEKSKVPYYIRLKNVEDFAFAGLYDIWKDNDGNALKTFTIITTKPNNTLGPIHNRMPVILHREQEELWLDITIQDTDILTQMLGPFPDNNMEAYAVSKEVNGSANDRHELH